MSSANPDPKPSDGRLQHAIDKTREAARADHLAENLDTGCRCCVCELERRYPAGWKPQTSTGKAQDPAPQTPKGTSADQDTKT